MATIVRTRIIKIGNSQGIRIPKLMLEQANFPEEVELAVQEDQIVIRPSHPVRYQWEEQFKIMAGRGDDLIWDETPTATTWDEEEWKW